MKLKTAINKLIKAGFEVTEIVEDRTYRATQEGKETIQISADSKEEVYAIYYVWEDEKTFVKNLNQAIKFS